MEENIEDNVYRVVMNEHKEHIVDTEDEAWEIIGGYPFGSRHIVYDSKGHVRPEFVPF